MQFDDKIRYSRSHLLPEIGEEGQESLSQAKMLVIGAGGLGSPALLYLASSGIGTIGIVDDDKVELSNLARQIIHTEYDIGNLKVESAKEAMEDINRNICINTYPTRLTEANIADIADEYDIILDGCDNFETRFLVNKYCHDNGKILISGAVQGFRGILSCFKSGLKHQSQNPCYECFMPKSSLSESQLSCSEVGVLPPLCGIVGSQMASEAIKEHLQIGQSLSGYILHIDLLRNSYKKVKLNKKVGCDVCSG